MIDDRADDDGGEVAVSRETVERRLDAFRAEFARWSSRINLTAADERGTIDERHIADSLQLLDHAGAPHRWVDVGTGGGFPGLVVAAALPPGTVTLVESNGKKAAFLRSAALAMGVAVDVRAERAERVVGALSPPDVVSARAVASLADLLILLGPWLAGGALGLFPKGRGAEAEIELAREAHDFDVERRPSRVAPDSTVLLITGYRGRRPT